MPLYVPLDVNWPDDDPVIEVGLDGAGLHAIILCLAKRSQRDGWVGRRSLNRYDATDELVGRLTDAGLIETDPDGRVRPVGWLKWNPTQEAIAAKKEAKRRAGLRGNHKRWHDGDFASCDLCHDDDPLVVAQCDTGAIAAGSVVRNDAIAKGREREAAIASSSQPATDPISLIRSQERGSPDAAKIARRAIKPMFTGPEPVEITPEIRSALDAHGSPMWATDTDAGGMGAGQVDGLTVGGA